MFAKEKELQSHSVSNLTGLYFDGRKDKTKVQVKKGAKYY